MIDSSGCSGLDVKPIRGTTKNRKHPTLPRAQGDNCQVSPEWGSCAPGCREHGGEHWNVSRVGRLSPAEPERRTQSGAQGQAPEDPRAPARLADIVPEHQDCTLREMAGAPVERVWGLSPRTVRVSREASSTCRGCASASGSQLGERGGGAQVWGTSAFWG